MQAVNRRPKKVSTAKAASYEACMDYLARLLSTRERSLQESQKRLLDKGYQEQVVSLVLERAQACGLLDDQRFAQGLIKDKLAAGWGTRRIEQELYRFGINKEFVEGYPEDFVTEEDQLQNALRALERHHSRSKNPQQAAYRYLISKGYSPDIVTAAIRAQEEVASDTW